MLKATSGLLHQDNQYVDRRCWKDILVEIPTDCVRYGLMEFGLFAMQAVHVMNIA